MNSLVVCINKQNLSSHCNKELETKNNADFHFMLKLSKGYYFSFPTVMSSWLELTNFNQQQRYLICQQQQQAKLGLLKTQIICYSTCAIG